MTAWRAWAEKWGYGWTYTLKHENTCIYIYIYTGDGNMTITNELIRGELSIFFWAFGQGNLPFWMVLLKFDFSCSYLAWWIQAKEMPMCCHDVFGPQPPKLYVSIWQVFSCVFTTWSQTSTTASCLQLLTGAEKSTDPRGENGGPRSGGGTTLAGAEQTSSILLLYIWIIVWWWIYHCINLYHDNSKWRMGLDSHIEKMTYIWLQPAVWATHQPAAEILGSFQLAMRCEATWSPDAAQVSLLLVDWCWHSQVSDNQNCYYVQFSNPLLWRRNQTWWSCLRISNHLLPARRRPRAN